MSKTTRTQFDFTDKTLADIDGAKEKMEASSRAEAVRRGMAFCHHALSAKKNGATVMIHYPDDRPSEVLFFGLATDRVGG